MATTDNDDVFTELFARPIAFHRVFARIGGGATAGLMLSQAWYWSQTKTVQKRDGWFYKCAAEWEDETGLTRREQQTARKHLVAAGLLEEEVRTQADGRVLWFRLKRKAVLEAIKAVAERVESSTEREPDPSHESDPPVAPNRQTPTGGSHQTARPVEQNRQTITETSSETSFSETSSENTHNTEPRLRAVAPAPAAPAGVVCEGSKFSLQECRRYARHLHASGQGIKNPDGFARVIHASGSEDELLALWLAKLEPERVESGELRAPVQVDASQCPDCRGSGMWYPGGMTPEGMAQGVAKCRHPKLTTAA